MRNEMSNNNYEIEKKDEKLLFQRFQQVATFRLEQMTKQADSGSYDAGQNELKMGEEEQRIISNMNGMGLKEGILASVVSFLILRRAPISIGKQVQRWRHSSTAGGTTRNNSSNYVLSDPTKLTTGSSNPFHRAATRNDFPRSRSLVSRSIWLAFDSIISLMVGANICFVCTDKNAIRQQIVELPLVSGRSLTADALCDDIVEELRKVREENNPAYERLTMQKNNKRGEDPNLAMDETTASYYMDGIVLFCENCERRRFYERRIREERGLGIKDQVDIPIPGIPRDGLRLVVSRSGEEMVVSKDEIEDPFFEQLGNDHARWADNFTSDRND
mmetsp:Transcript_25557/g.28576  ORF Transcript_25557/g.28576 Transcript_25557/m.28576 type:complete len:331 (+) Transcript_25557:197-1189(+)